MIERKGEVTVKGNPLTLLGEKLAVGDAAPDFKVLDCDLKEISPTDFKGKVKLISAVPSLDTAVCEAQTKRFNEEASKIAKDAVIITISMDLPFAQKRFCDAYKIGNIKVYSDHRDASFGINYGVLIKELRLLARSIFVVGSDDKIRYIEIVEELTSQPDYKAALFALKEAA